MLKATLVEELNRYDEKKGRFFRSWVRDEPHIKELRIFVNHASDELTDKELLKLVRILLGKTSRNKAESGQTFVNLVNQLGGYAALEYLNQKKQLKPVYVRFLAANHLHARELAQAITNLCQTFKFPDVCQFLDSVNQLKDPVNLVNTFMILGGSNVGSSHLRLINALNHYGICLDEILIYLTGSHDIDSVLKIINTLQTHNPELITLDNVIRIFKLQNPADVSKFLDLLLPITQEVLDDLVEEENSLPQLQAAEEIIANFRESEWDLVRYRKLILKEVEFGLNLKNATDRLKTITLSAEQLDFILGTLFLYSVDSVILAESVSILSQNELVAEELKIAFRTPTYSDSVAAAMVILKNEKQLTKTGLDFITSHPEFSRSLASLFVALESINCYDREIRKAILENAKNAEILYQIIKLLIVNNVQDKSCMLMVCQTALPKTLLTACRCLANAEKFDQDHLESILKDPVNAIAIADSLGGVFTDSDAGMRDYIQIRTAAKTLAQMHQKISFFPREPKESIIAREKTRDELQNESLIAIALHTGNHYLEGETELNIAKSTFDDALTFR